MAEILEQLNNLKELGYIQKAHLNVLEVALEDYKTEIRAKAIDELKNKVCMHFADWKYSEDDKRIKDIIELASESVEEIAEQMKGEKYGR